jgi:hypothetical protein
MARQPGTVGAGPFDTDPVDQPERTEPQRQRVISRGCRRERLHTQQPADRIQRGRNMNIKVRVDTTDDGTRHFYDGHAIPFLFEVVGWHARPGKETVSSALL